jgi:hypothetical protein
MRVALASVLHTVSLEAGMGHSGGDLLLGQAADWNLLLVFVVFFFFFSSRS